jgi:hypothetical protein
VLGSKCCVPVPSEWVTLKDPLANLNVSTLLPWASTACDLNAPYAITSDLFDAARSCGHSLDRPTPASMPHTVPLPVWAKNPQARPQKVRYDGAVNNGPKTASRLASETGTGSVTLGIIAENPGSPALSQHSVPVTRRRRPRRHQPRRRPRLAAARQATAIMDSMPDPPDPQTQDRGHPADHRPRHARLAPPSR